MPIDSKKLKAIHEMFLSKSPDSTQEHLYAAYPKARGFSHNERDLSILDATIILGLAQTWPENEEEPNQVFFLVRSADELVWCLKRLKEIAKGFFERLKKMPSQKEAKVKAAKLIASFFNNLRIGISTQFDEPPAHWVSYSYLASDPVPTWMRDKLISVPVAVDMFAGVEEQ